LRVWTEADLLRRSWRYMAVVIAKAPNNIVRELSNSLGGWLEAVAKTAKDQNDLFFEIIRRVLGQAGIGGADQYADDDPVFSAINHPVGKVTHALIHWWYRQEPKNFEGLCAEIEPLFSEICDIGTGRFRNGRVILSAHAVALFRVDEKWTREHILPLFDWENSEIEARAAWAGFLWSSQLFRRFLEAVKRPILETASHYEQLGKNAHQFATFLTFAALDRADTFQAKELATAVGNLPPEGLEHSAQTLVRALNGANDQQKEYWQNRILVS